VQAYLESIHGHTWTSHVSCTVKTRFPLPELTARVDGSPVNFPLPVNTGRVDGRPVSI